MSDPCDWCGDPIGPDETRMVVTETDSLRYKTDPSFPEAQFHLGTCFEEAARHGWRNP